MVSKSSVDNKHNAVNTGYMVYRYMVIGASSLPLICLCMVTLFAFVVIMYVLGGFIVIAVS